MRSICAACSEAESDGDSPEWPMEQEEAISSLLCETPSLLPTLSLSLVSTEGPQEPESHAVAPTTAATTPAQITISSYNQGKGIKVGDETPELNYAYLVFVTHV